MSEPRTLAQILEGMLGSYQMQLAQLLAANEAKDAQIATLEAALAALKQAHGAD